METMIARNKKTSGSKSVLSKSNKRDALLYSFARRVKRFMGLHGKFAILVTDNETMRRLNHRFRKKNKPTDVLSFPATWSGHVGEIAISKQIAAANAKKLGHPLEMELKVLVLHGLLHLAGHDHETDDGLMAKKELLLR